MQGKWIRLTASAAMALALLGTLSAEEAKAAEGFDLTVIHTNDTHAHLENGAERATVIKQLKGQNPNHLLLDAGDVFSGTLYFNEFLGQADLKLMNYLGYDAMTFGNHEFDLGSVEEDHGTLAEFIGNAEFPFVSANTDFSAYEEFQGLNGGDITGEFENGKYYKGIIKEVGGEKVGIFGLTTEETADISTPNDITFSEYEQAAKDAVAEFEEQGVNKVIALTHMGYDSNAAFGNDKLLAEKVEGIDIIVGGHSHTALDEPIKTDTDNTPTVIVQTGEYANNIGELNVTFDEQGVITEISGELHPTKGVEKDPEAAELLKEYDQAIEAKMSEPTGVEAAVPLDGSRGLWGVRAGETNLGNLITDGMLATAKSINPDVSIAMTNGGGIRAGIDAGEITVGEVLTVMPFGNTLGIARLQGFEIKAALEHAVRQFPAENGGFLHVAGMKYYFDGSAEPGSRVNHVLVQNKHGLYELMDFEKEYYVATNTFTAKGGDGFDMFEKAYKEGRVSEPGNVDWEMFIDYIGQFEEVAPQVEGRIRALVPFKDLKLSDEFTPYIGDLYYQGLIKGVTPETFAQYKPLTRAQAASILVRALDLDTEGATSSFSDLKHIAPETVAEIAAAEQAGLVQGLNGKFMPNKPITRAQLALMLMRHYEVENGETYSPEGPAPFNDIQRFGEETQRAVSFLYEHEIASGVNGTFMPAKPATRGQSAKIYSNYLDVLK